MRAPTNFFTSKALPRKGKMLTLQFGKMPISHMATIFVRKEYKSLKLFSIELSQGPHEVVVARDKLPSQVLRGAPV